MTVSHQTRRSRRRVFGLFFALLGVSLVAVVSAVTPTFTRVIIDAGQSPWGKALGDIDGDGFIDAIIGIDGSGVYWYQYPNWTKSTISTINGGDDLQVGDINNDSASDIVTNGSQIVWYQNPKGSGGNPATSTWTRHVIDSSTNSHDVVIGDVNNDGKPDVAIRVEFGPTFLYIQNTADSWTKIVVTTASNGNALALTDVDGDGRIDIVENGYWLGQPASGVTGTWTRHDFVSWTSGSSVMIADMNKDGRADVVLSPSESAGKISWFEKPVNPSTGTWFEHVVVPSVSYVHRVRVADFNRDGNLDIAFAEMDQAGTNRVAVGYNTDGLGNTWSLQVLATTAGHNIAIGDIGNDGDIDILNANWRSSNVEIWRNDLYTGQKPSKVLVFSKTLGFRHASIAAGIAAIQSLGTQNNFTADATEDANMFTDVNLANYRAVIFLNPSGNILNTSQQGALQRFIQTGNGFVGVHNATALLDPAMDAWAWYNNMLGAKYQSEIDDEPLCLQVRTVAHPSTASLPNPWCFTEEAYNFDRNPKTLGAIVLLNLDETTVSGGTMGSDHPFSWYKPYDGGRMWYTNGGANDADYSNANFRSHLLGGIQYAASMSSAGAPPPPLPPSPPLNLRIIP